VLIYLSTGTTLPFARRYIPEGLHFQVESAQLMAVALKET
jgi:hypothetical protein